MSESNRIVNPPHRTPPARATALVALALVAAACAPTIGPPGEGGVGGGDGAMPAAVDGPGGGHDDGGGAHKPDGAGDGPGAMGACANPLDVEGCACSGVGTKRSCYTGPAATQGKGTCHDGTQSCVASGEFSTWGPCTGDVTPVAETCNDTADRNCNGLVGCDDPECGGKLGCCKPGEMRKCWDGPMGAEGVGICKPGMQTCTAKGAWPKDCLGETLPGMEAGHCHDGLDNDCNGLVDCKDPACFADPGCKPTECSPGATKPCYTGKQGTSGVGPCKPGLQTCDPQGHWMADCNGQVLPGVEFGHCTDKIDNDCNGKTDCDDLFACFLDPACQPKACTPGQTKSCYDGPKGTEGVGPCKAGTQTCSNDGKGYGACTGQQLPAMEGGHCSDGIDNDCNGLVDCQDPACATAPNCCTPGGGNVDGTLYAHSSDKLYRVDPSTFAVTLVGAFGAGEEITDLAMTPAGKLYVISFTSLYSVDKASAKATLVGAIPGSGNNSMTFLADGTLLVADSAGAVKRVNPASGAVTQVGAFGNGLSSSGDLVAVADGTMYGVSSTSPGGGDASSSNVLLRVDVKTGAATPVGPIGYGAVWGLAYAKSRLIGFTNTGQILQIDPQTGKGMLIASKGIQFWGAGMSPLVPANPCP